MEFDEYAPIRDVDLVAVEEIYEGDSEELRELSQEYMPDDYNKGYGVDYEYMEEYFHSRDFTINEVMVLGSAILVTEQGYKDLRDKVIRPTEYELDEYDDTIRPKLQAKALLMEALFQEVYGKGENKAVIDDLYPDGFFTALAFNKALEYGADVANRFIKNFDDHYDLENSDLVDIGVELAERSGFDFRGSYLANCIMSEARVDVDSDSQQSEYDDDWEDLDGLGYEARKKYISSQLARAAVRVPKEALATLDEY